MNTFKYKYVEYNIWDIFRPKKLLFIGNLNSTGHPTFLFTKSGKRYMWVLWRMRLEGVVEQNHKGLVCHTWPIMRSCQSL